MPHPSVSCPTCRPETFVAPGDEGTNGPCRESGLRPLVGDAGGAPTGDVSAGRPSGAPRSGRPAVSDPAGKGNANSRGRRRGHQSGREAALSERDALRRELAETRVRLAEAQRETEARREKVALGLAAAQVAVARLHERFEADQASWLARIAELQARLNESETSRARVEAELAHACSLVDDQRREQERGWAEERERLVLRLHDEVTAELEQARANWAKERQNLEERYRDELADAVRLRDAERQAREAVWVGRVRRVLAAARRSSVERSEPVAQGFEREQLRAACDHLAGGLEVLGARYKAERLALSEEIDQLRVRLAEAERLRAEGEIELAEERSRRVARPTTADEPTGAIGRVVAGLEALRVEIASLRGHLHGAELLRPDGSGLEVDGRWQTERRAQEMRRNRLRLRLVEGLERMIEEEGDEHEALRLAAEQWVRNSSGPRASLSLLAPRPPAVTPPPTAPIAAATQANEPAIVVARVVNRIVAPGSPGTSAIGALGR